MIGKRSMASGMAAGLVLALVVGLALAQAPEAPLGTAFTYQGRLKSGETSYSGTCDLTFDLWDALTGGSQVGTQTVTGVVLTDGYFAVQLDYGTGQFAGDARWLAISVCCPTGSCSYEPLTPRQALTASPYALYALGIPMAGSGSASTAAHSDHDHGGTYWSLSGNAGTDPASQFLGTTDAVSLTLAVSGTAALRLEPAVGDWYGLSPNLVGGAAANQVTAGVVGATIGGGGSAKGCGSWPPYLDPCPNRVTGNFGTVAGGMDNSVSGLSATIGGGWSNRAGGEFTTVAGGLGDWATSRYATVGGGSGNRAGGDHATIPGGENNAAAGDHSFAAGCYAKANDDGAFVWADKAYQNFTSTADNQFLVRARGGVGINTNAPAANTLTVSGDGLRVATDGTTFKRIQAGTATLGSATGSGVHTFTVIFPVAFSSTPAVIATARGANYDDTFVITTRSISTTQFDVNVWRVDNVGGSWGQSLQLDWIAWE